MQRRGLIDHLATDSEAVYFDLLVASLERIERFPYSFGLAGLIEHCTVEVRWRAQLSLVGHLDCSVDNCSLPDPGLLMTSFAESPHLNVWLEGLAELAAVPLSLAYTTREKPDSALVCYKESPRFADIGQQVEALATVPMMACCSDLGKIVEVPRVEPSEQKDG